ncbi:hypothetical protein MMC06_000411 [Schaereria dolodes]|nr:hypothetical protein [Schaereria dolodes]
MTQPFSFAFDNDDIEDDASDIGGGDHMDTKGGPPLAVDKEEAAALIEPSLHTLEELLSHLPSSIAYRIHNISPHTTSSTAISLPRRELYDIRTQLMAEDDPSGLQDPVANSGLSTDDITPKIYEGGFKTWECAVDLARYLSGAIQQEKLILQHKDIRVIEVYTPLPTHKIPPTLLTLLKLGAGTALPTLTLLSHLFSASKPNSSLSSPDIPTAPRTIHITLADYNPSVLSLSTIPNLLLTWAAIHHPTGPLPTHGDLEITLSLLSSFIESLSQKGIHINALSGTWGSAFDQSVQNNPITILLLSRSSSPAKPSTPPPPSPSSHAPS